MGCTCMNRKEGEKHEAGCAIYLAAQKERLTLVCIIAGCVAGGLVVGDKRIVQHARGEIAEHPDHAYVSKFAWDLLEAVEREHQSRLSKSCQR